MIALEIMLVVQVTVSKCAVDQKRLTYSNADSLLRLKVVLRIALFRSAREPRSAFGLTQCDGSLSRGQKEGGTCNGPHESGL